MPATLPPIASYAHLIGEHAEIAARAHALSATLPTGNAGSIRTALDRLADSLIEHLATEDQAVHPYLMTVRDGGTQLAAKAAQRRYRTLADDWLGLIERWTERRIAGDGAGFASAASGLIDRLHKRIAEENELLYPAALLGGHMALRG